MLIAISVTLSLNKVNRLIFLVETDTAHLLLVTDFNLYII